MSVLCQTCAAIPFSSLPREEEDAWPHHPTWASLKASASTCRSCKIIRLAVERLYRKICLQFREGSTGLYLWDGSWRSGSVPPINENMPVWIFGNWWASVPEGPLDQLVGLGVRLGQTPSIENAEGAGENLPELRGTDLRICTSSGRLLCRKKATPS